MSHDDDLDEPTAQERQEASVSRNAVDDGGDPLIEALVASSRPRELDAALHERILAKALGEAALDREPAATPKETADASLLRRALDGEDVDTDARVASLLALFVALRSAYAPRPLDQLSSERILRPALAAVSKRTRRVAFAFALSAAVAVAAGVAALFFKGPVDDGNTVPQASAALLPGMIEARSTGELFGPDDFAQGSEQTTQRIDRISTSREADLRNNHFVAWGVP